MSGKRFCENQIPRFFRVPPRSAQRAESTGGLGALAAVHSLDPLCASTSALRSTAGQGQDFLTNQRLWLLRTCRSHGADRSPALWARAMKADLHPPALALTWPSSSRSRRRTAVVVCPDVSGRCAAVCDGKRDAVAPFGSNPGPAASADEQMRPRTRATPSCRRSQPQGIVS